MHEKYRIFYMPKGEPAEVRVKCFLESEEQKFYAWLKRLEEGGTIYFSCMSLYDVASNVRVWYRMKEEYCNKSHIVEVWMDKGVPLIVERHSTTIVTHPS